MELELQDTALNHSVNLTPIRSVKFDNSCRFDFVIIARSGARATNALSEGGLTVFTEPLSFLPLN